MALKAWLERAGITSVVFRKVDQWTMSIAAPLPAVGQSHPEVARSASGPRYAAFAAHGLRSGFMTESANLGIPLLETMQQSLHRSATQAAGYYNDAERKMGRAVRVLI